MYEDSALADNYDDVRTIITFLIEHKDYSLFNPEVADKIDKLRKFQEIFCCKSFFYEEHIKKLQGHHSEVIRHGTVGAFLFSCFLNTRIYNKECSPTCLDGGLKNPDQVECQKNVVWKRNGQLQLLTEEKDLTPDKETLLFLAQNESVTRLDQEFFYRHHISQVQVFQQERDYITFTKLTDLEINKLNDVTETNNNESYIFWWLLLFILLIVGLFLLWQWYTKK